MKNNSTEGTKIAQAAKELNVTSVTIRRYIAEFDIETETDDNGIKVLPEAAITELHEVRKLKEDGLSNPQVMERLEELRTARGAKPSTKAKVVEELEVEEEAEQEEKPVRRPRRVAAAETEVEESTEVVAEEGAAEGAELGEAAAASRTKHSLTCQTCSKVFEHMNPRLRDCLECYRTKRKERRRGGGQKTVIQHPLAAQVASKSAAAPQSQSPEVRKGPVRNYRKAIEDTRHITSNLKRRLERPDLGEGERRWLEQIYAYQLILHQGWRHLAEYRSGTKEQSQAET